MRQAEVPDVDAIAAIRAAAAEDLTAKYGKGHWSTIASERSVVRTLSDSHVIVATAGERVVGTLRLATKKPWAIDRALITPVKRPLYLLDMVVAPAMQKRGIGRELLNDAQRIARKWPAQSIVLDAYDAAAGAGEFYLKCGYREIGRKNYHEVPLVYFELLL